MAPVPQRFGLQRLIVYTANEIGPDLQLSLEMFAERVRMEVIAFLSVLPE